MKKLSLLIVLTLATLVGLSQSVMISQYIETNSGSVPKGIEIFNYSGSDITFSGANNLQVFQGTNGAACSALVNITSGTLRAGEVWVIGTSDLVTYANANGTNLSGTTTQAFTFNGDDALQIYLGGVLQDVFGTCGTDPGSAWSGSGVSTANQNIQTISGVCTGTTSNWTNPSLRFETVSTNPVADLTGFGTSPSSCISTCTPPTTQPSAINFSSVTTTGMTIDWTGGNGSNSLVVISEGTPVVAAPGSGSTYTANTVFGSGQDLGSNNYVVYNGTANTVTITGLTANTTYYVSVFEFDNATSCYNTTSPATNNQTTACGAIPDPVTSFVGTPGNTQVTLNWTNPSGCFDEVLVVAEDGLIGFSPSGNGATYVANSVYGSGTCVNCTGSNNEYVVYKGTVNTVTVTGLTNGVEYCFRIWVRYGTGWSSYEVDCVTPSVPIPDNGCGSSSYATMTFDYTGTGPIADVDISVFIEHTYRGDLYIEVESPNGTVVPILSSEGGSADNLEATFDDEAAGTISSSTHTLDGTIDETVQSTVGTLSDFDGENPFGTWIIRVCDDAGADIGDLISWYPTIVESCTPTHTISGFSPTSGPEMTIITVTGTGFSATSTVSIGGVAANVTFINSTTLKVEIPTGATTDVITVTEGGCPTASSGTFTVIGYGGACSAGTAFGDLIISEVYDSDALNVWYIELYNPTGSPIDLAAENYQIQRYGTAWTTVSRTIDLTGVVPAGSVFLLNIGDSPNTCTETWDFSEAGPGINDGDGIMLVKNGTDVDAVICPNNTGYSILRNSAATGPTSTYNGADWTVSNTEDCSDLGTFGAPLNTPPSVTSEPADLHACSIDFGIAATAGSGGGTLTYQWIYNDGVSAGWSNVTAGDFSPSIVSGENSLNLIINGDPSDIENYDGYQFYCLVTEDGSCYAPSDAAQFKAKSEADPEMITSMVNGCQPGGTASCSSEGYNEFIALEIGSEDVVISPANISVSYGATYPASTTYTDGFTANAGLTSQFNSQNAVNGCGTTLFVDAVATGTLPADATVFLMSENVCPEAYDFSSLCGTGPIYLLYSTDGSWGSTGNFSNSGAGDRYFSMSITDVTGYTTTTEYDYSPNSLTDNDGDYVEFEFCSSNAYNYGNEGCSVKSITLPVELVFFTAQKQEKTVALTWETSSEINCDKFVVMRSKEGGEFQPIGTVQGSGNSTSPRNYGLIDEDPFIGDNYYMLYQYDYDGHLNKSDMRLVNFDNGTDFNVASANGQMMIFYNNLSEDAYFEIFAVDGRLLKQVYVPNVNGSISFEMPAQKQYIVRLISANHIDVKKVIH